MYYHICLFVYFSCKCGPPFFQIKIEDPTLLESNGSYTVSYFDLFRISRINADALLIAGISFKLHGAADQREQRIIRADADILAGMHIVPRCLTIILPATTACPSAFLTPSAVRYCRVRSLSNRHLFYVQKTAGLTSTCLSTSKITINAPLVQPFTVRAPRYPHRENHNNLPACR